MKHGHFSIWWNTVILLKKEIGGTWSFLNSVEHGHFYIFPDLVEHGHFKIWWNTVIFCKLVKHGHFSIRWNTVISQFGGTQSFFVSWWNVVISQFGGTVISQFGRTVIFCKLVKHGHFSIWWNTVIFKNRLVEQLRLRNVCVPLNWGMTMSH